MTTPLVTADVSVSYGGLQALRDISLEVARGKIVGLIGPNGAGKTTFIDAVTGFTPCRGSVVLNGHEVSHLAPHRRARLGLSRTWQAAELFDDLTVTENLSVAGSAGSLAQLVRQRLSRTGPDLDQAQQGLERMQLTDLSEALPEELSQGQRKLVGVARALMRDPEVVLLDEPAAGLDPGEREELGVHLRSVVADGPGMLLVDHDMGLVLSVCDSIVVLDFGRVIARGRPEEIRHDPAVILAYIGEDDMVAEPAALDTP